MGYRNMHDDQSRVTLSNARIEERRISDRLYIGPNKRTGVQQIHAGAWPHGAGCEHCRKHKLCNECGKPWDYERLIGGLIHSVHMHCTNGRCIDCHSTVCGSGPAHAPYRHNRYIRTADELAAGMSLAEKVRSVKGG